MTVSMLKIALVCAESAVAVSPELVLSHAKVTINNEVKTNAGMLLMLIKFEVAGFNRVRRHGIGLLPLMPGQFGNNKKRASLGGG
jgi:hypothetical protein